MFFQLVSVAGALLILGAYVANNRRWIGPGDRIYNGMNLLGALLLLAQDNENLLGDLLHQTLDCCYIKLHLGLALFL